jgi:integrase/recombinase XerD
VEKYVGCLIKFTTWFGKPLEQVTKKDLQRYKEHMAVTGLSDNSAVVEVSALNQFFVCVLERPELQMKPPRRVETTRIPLTESEVQRILNEAKSPATGATAGGGQVGCIRNHAMIALMYYGGLRVSEVSSLFVADLDLDNRRVRIRCGKGKDFSQVNLADNAVTALREWVDFGRPNVPDSDKTELLFLTVNGNPLGRNDVWRMVKTVAFNAGIEKKVHPHIFRHSMITHMAERGLSASFIQAQSRHKSLDMVAHYVHLSQASVREAYDKAFSQEGAAARSAPPESPKTQIPTVIPTNGALFVEDRHSRLLDMFVAGKISYEQLTKLLSTIESSESQSELL